MKRLLVFLSLAALAWPAAAPAQDMFWSNVLPSVTGTDTLGLHLREEAERRTATRPPAPPTAASLAALRFTPSARRRKANFARFIDARRGSADATSIRQLEAILADPQFIPKVDAELRKSGLRADDVADAWTVWWIQSWQAVHGQVGEPSPAAVRAVRAQVQRAVLATPALLNGGDAGKQAFAEELLVQAVIFGAVTEQLQGQPSEQRRFSEGLRRQVRAMGVDLGALALTDQGFAPKG